MGGTQGARERKRKGGILLPVSQGEKLVLCKGLGDLADR
jgi:hypothetical protein